MATFYAMKIAKNPKRLGIGQKRTVPVFELILESRNEVDCAARLARYLHEHPHEDPKRWVVAVNWTDQ